jgi:uncharacterized protein YbjT (DUF2867 family)
VARVLILGGGCRGRQLAAEVIGEGHAVRIVTRSGSRRAAIEALGAECYIGDPNRLATLRGVMDGVTVACWLLATATGSSAEVRELHVSRLPAFLGQAVDSTMRGFIYEAPADVPAEAPTNAPARLVALTSALAEGAQLVQEIAERNAIPIAALTAAPHDQGFWLKQARATLSLYL